VQNKMLPHIPISCIEKQYHSLANLKASHILDCTA
jgi:hypothetical protein